MSTCRSPQPTPPGDNQPINCATQRCSPYRNFVIIYGDPGLGRHNLGRQPELAALTHLREVSGSVFPGVPSFSGNDGVVDGHVSTVSELLQELAVGNVMYFAYFGHSWNRESNGALLINENAVPDGNLTNAPGPNNTPVTALSPGRFRADAQIRLFGCRGGFGSNSIAEQLRAHLGVTTYGYSNEGGSLFTTDRVLGHGSRSVTQADIDAKIPNHPENVWLVPANGTPTFRQF